MSTLEIILIVVIVVLVLSLLLAGFALSRVLKMIDGFVKGFVR